MDKYNERVRQVAEKFAMGFFGTTQEQWIIDMLPLARISVADEAGAVRVALNKHTEMKEDEVEYYLFHNGFMFKPQNDGE